MWTAAQDILVTDLQDELILMDAAGGVMFSLNDSGREVWQMLPATVQTLSEHFQQHYGLSAEVAQADILRLLQNLQARGLVQQR